MNSNLTSIIPVILCGGTGTRLWPLSRESFPKQFIPLIQGRSLLSLTLERVRSLAPPICIANDEHRFLVNDLLDKQSNQTASNSNRIILEPVGRNTAAAMVNAALMPGIEAKDLLLFLPSDHYIPDINLFLATIQTGVLAAQKGYIVTFGVHPTYPSTAYGYIKQGDNLRIGSPGLPSPFAVNSFIEKPHLFKAQEMLLSGGYFWNAGIFLCEASTLINALLKHAPDILESCRDAMLKAKFDGNFIRPEREAFLACRSLSIDYAVMESFEKVAVVPFSGAWSDVGSWNAVAELSDADQSGNRINGQGIVPDSTNTYIFSPHRPIIALGVSNLIIVDTPDAVLVMASEKVEQVKDVVAKLKENGFSQAITHRQVSRPWGWYDSIDSGEGFQVKRITVKPGCSLSLQMHFHRAEHWVVVNGIAKVTNGEEVFFLKENQSTYIPIGVKHRLENPGEALLEMIEVQSGDYLGEDDIVRFEDNYGRK